MREPSHLFPRHVLPKGNENQTKAPNLAIFRLKLQEEHETIIPQLFLLRYSQWILPPRRKQVGGATYQFSQTINLVTEIVVCRMSTKYQINRFYFFCTHTSKKGSQREGTHRPDRHKIHKDTESDPSML
jgi:hypothetical protein